MHLCKSLEMNICSSDALLLTPTLIYMKRYTVCLHRGQQQDDVELLIVELHRSTALFSFFFFSLFTSLFTLYIQMSGPQAWGISSSYTGASVLLRRLEVLPMGVQSFLSWRWGSTQHRQHSPHVVQQLPSDIGGPLVLFPWVVVPPALDTPWRSTTSGSG